MRCLYPLDAWRVPNGEIKFHDNGSGDYLQLPCGQCINCRLTRSAHWAVRCVHEASLHEDNCFITLTYNPENLPPDCGLVKSDFQKFIKRLRKYLKGRKIKYFQCGEYGDRNNRPHYHAIIFNYNFDDWVYLFDSPSGEPIYSSPTLEKIWGLGFVTIGTVTFESASYVARYCLKKINGKKADEIDPATGLKHYERINSHTGEISEVWPEYCTMSRGGRSGRGIAHDWISKYTSDFYPKDFTTIRGRRVSPPAYYDRYLKSIDPFMYDDIKQGRVLTNLSRELPSLDSAIKIAKAKKSNFKRSL